MFFTFHDETDNSFGRHFSPKLGHEDDEVDEEDDQDDDDEEEEGGGDDAQHARDVEDLFAGGNNLSVKKFGQKRRLVYARNLGICKILCVGASARAPAARESTSHHMLTLYCVGEMPCGNMASTSRQRSPAMYLPSLTIPCPCCVAIVLHLQEKQHKPPAEG